MSNKIKDIYHWLKNSNKNLDDALYFYKNIDELPHFKKVWSKRTIVERYIHASIIFFKRIVTLFDNRRVSNPLSKNLTTILYVNSNNTFHSLEFLKTNEEICFFEQSNRISPYLSSRGSITHNIKTPLWIIILSFFNFPIYGLFFWRKSFKHPHLYFENWGKDYVNIKLLRNCENINKAIFANDHNVENRLFKSACEKEKIKTIYLQHASITSLFPQLDFDQSFLFGEADLMKYKSVGEVKGEVILAGSPKFDQLYQHRRNISFQVTNTIGLGLNIIDDGEKIKSLVETVLTNTSYNIIIRMHPGDKREFKFNSERVKTHNARKVSLINFFAKIDFLISGESSIHLESVYLGIPSLYFNLSKTNISDNYDFLKSGLLGVLDDSNISNEYFMDLAQNVAQMDLIKKFLDSFSRDYDGRVSDFVKNKIFDLKDER